MKHSDKDNVSREEREKGYILLLLWAKGKLFIYIIARSAGIVHIISYLAFCDENHDNLFLSS